jgi:excisionase family DNA binding protein
MTETTFTHWDDVPLLLTTDEAATLLRLHVNTIKYMIRNGKLPAARVGRAWRIPREAVLAVRGGETTGHALRAVILDLRAALQPFAALYSPEASDEVQYFIPTEWIIQAKAAIRRAEALGVDDGTSEQQD